MNKNKTNEISTIYGREKLRVTCIERRYKVEDSKVSFIVNAKKEFDENTTSKLLHEDMELKTFLANYEITDVILQPAEIENVETVGRLTKNAVANKESILPARNLPKNNIPKDAIKNLTQRQIREATIERRQLFDTLDLTEEFRARDYVKALEDKGIKITNDAMPYDDLKRLEKQGKVTSLAKREYGPRIYKKAKKDDVENNREELINTNIQ